MTGLPFAPASDRNKGPILDALLDRLPDAGRLLEIGSGTGQHAVYMAPRFPALVWQTSDRAGELAGLAARLGAEGGPNLPPPLCLDVLTDAWPVGAFDAAYSANTSHIMSWVEVRAMFGGLGRALSGGAPFCLYGPFNRNGGYTAPSNAEFDRSLRARNPDMGLRDLGDLERLGRDHQLALEEILDLPVNNMLLTFRRAGT